MTESLDIIDALKSFRYAQPAIKALKAIWVRRMRVFLNQLEAAADELPLEQRKQFETFINSALGAELLTDFVDQIVRTRSKTAAAALALLYARPIDQEEKADMALALDGISERSIDVFLMLVQTEIGNGVNGAVVSNEVVRAHARLSAGGWDDETWVVSIDDLMARGLLGRDLTHAGRIGGETGWDRLFRFTERSAGFRELLSKARRYSDPTSVLGL